MSEPLDLDALEALDQAATPGPWDTDMVGYLARHPGVDGFAFPERAAEERDEIQRDKDFIVAARAAVPALVAEVREARDLRNGLRVLIDQAEKGEGVFVDAGFTELKTVDVGLIRRLLNWCDGCAMKFCEHPDCGYLRAIVQSDTGANP